MLCLKTTALLAQASVHHKFSGPCRKASPMGCSAPGAWRWRHLRGVAPCGHGPTSEARWWQLRSLLAGSVNGVRVLYRCASDLVASKALSHAGTHFCWRGPAAQPWRCRTCVAWFSKIGKSAWARVVVVPSSARRCLSSRCTGKTGSALSCLRRSASQ